MPEEKEQALLDQDLLADTVSEASSTESELLRQAEAHYMDHPGHGAVVGSTVWQVSPHLQKVLGAQDRAYPELTCTTV